MKSTHEIRTRFVRKVYNESIFNGDKTFRVTADSSCVTVETSFQEKDSLEIKTVSEATDFLLSHVSS